MFKTLLAAMLAVVITTGCSDRMTQLNFPALPADMADCKIVRVMNSAGEGLTLARCPNSTTAVKVGKNPPTITVDGDTYVKEKK